jgi:hypothetical protein
MTSKKNFILMAMGNQIDALKVKKLKEYSRNILGMFKG